MKSLKGNHFSKRPSREREGGGKREKPSKLETAREPLSSFIHPGSWSSNADRSSRIVPLSETEREERKT